VFCESFCSSAAEKRDYAAFRLIRQLIFFFSALDLFDFCVLQKQDANYSKPKHGHARTVFHAPGIDRAFRIAEYALDNFS
jgi:hypothetical protein